MSSEPEVIRRIKALVWADSHFREAHFGCEHLISILRGNVSVELYHCIFCGIVNCYCRIFTRSDGMYGLKAEFSKFSNADLKKLHKDLLELRNGVYAHRSAIYEAEVREKQPELGLQKIKIVVAGDGYVRWYGKKIRYAVPLEDIDRLCLFQMNRVSEQMQKIIESYGNKDVGEFDLLDYFDADFTAPDQTNIQTHKD